MAGGYGKSAATSYSDYYSKNSNTPNTDDNPDLSTNPPGKPSPTDATERRRAALRRRLRKNVESPRKTMKAV